jgi:hypothetical protein
MKGRRVWEIGGFVSGAVLILFGAVAIVLGVNGYRTVQDELDKEYIVGGSDMSPDEIKAGAEEAGLPARIKLPSCNVVDEEIDTGSEARCFAQYMRVHALESTGGLTYAQMGRFQSAANPDDAQEPATKRRLRRTRADSRYRTEPGTSGSRRRRSQRR